MGTSKATIDTKPSSDAPKPDHCPECGRRHRLTGHYREPTPCYRCLELRRLANWWANAEGPEVLDRCARIGVGPGFCRDGRPPTYADPGLAERLSTKPLPKGGLLILGPVGSHKTHLACARAIDAARRGYTAQLMNWSRLCLEVRQTYARASTMTELQVIDRYARLDYLCIDDFGLGRSAETEASVKLAYDILDARYSAARTTDITSNLLPEDLEQRFDGRVMRRIRELTTPYVMLADETPEQLSFDLPEPEAGGEQQ